MQIDCELKLPYKADRLASAPHNRAPFAEKVKTFELAKDLQAICQQTFFPKPGFAFFWSIKTFLNCAFRSARFAFYLF